MAASIDQAPEKIRLFVLKGIFLIYKWPALNLLKGWADTLPYYYIVTNNIHSWIIRQNWKCEYHIICLVWKSFQDTVKGLSGRFKLALARAIVAFSVKLRSVFGKQYLKSRTTIDHRKSNVRFWRLRVAGEQMAR